MGDPEGSNESDFGVDGSGKAVHRAATRHMMPVAHVGPKVDIAEAHNLDDNWKQRSEQEHVDVCHEVNGCYVQQTTVMGEADNWLPEHVKHRTRIDDVVDTAGQYIRTALEEDRHDSLENGDTAHRDLESPDALRLLCRLLDGDMKRSDACSRSLQPMAAEEAVRNRSQT